MAIRASVLVCALFAMLPAARAGIDTPGSMESLSCTRKERTGRIRGGLLKDRSDLPEQTENQASPTYSRTTRPVLALS